MTAEMTRFVRRAFAAVLIVALVVAVAYAIEIVLLVFAGILLAILLRTTGTWLSKSSGFSIKGSMAIVLVVFGAALFGTIWLFGLQIVHQADELFAAISQAYTEFQQKLQEYRIARQFMSSVPSLNLQATATAAVSSLLWVAAAVVLILFLGLYLSTGPELYLDSFLSFFPATHRARVSRLLDGLGGALRWWLFGQFIAMVIVGIITTVGLLILKAPMAISLGVVAGLLTFVPYVGAIVSAIPAILIALTKGGALALWVVVVYLIAHVVEGYIVVPLVQHRLVYLPPAMILATQFLMEIFAGTAGLTFAVPLMVVAMVLIKRLYFNQDWTD